MGKILKARKRPVEVLAFLYRRVEDAESLIYYMDANKLPNSSEYAYIDLSKSTSIFIVKDCGEVELHLGDYLLWEINTDKVGWAIEPNIFKETYEWVDEKNHLARKLSIVNECMFYSSIDDVQSILRFMGYHSNDTLSVVQFSDLVDSILVSIDKSIIVPTLEGNLRLNIGEYLMKGVRGEFYPVRSDMFSKVYDILE